MTSNHGKDKKGLHPFSHWNTSGPLWGPVWVLCVKMEHDGA